MFFYGYMRQLVNVLAGMSKELVHERKKERERETRRTKHITIATATPTECDRTMMIMMMMLMWRRSLSLYTHWETITNNTKIKAPTMMMMMILKHRSLTLSLDYVIRFWTWVLDARQNHYSNVFCHACCFRSLSVRISCTAALISFGQSFGALHLSGWSTMRWPENEIAHEMRLLLDTLNHCLCCCLHFMHVQRLWATVCVCVWLACTKFSGSDSLAVMFWWPACVYWVYCMPF